MSFYCNSQCLLNPYRGIVNCIRYRSAEAVTADGVHRDIYASNESLLDEASHGQKIQPSDIRYGKWSAGAGLKRGPIFSSSEFRAMQDLGAIVYRHLLKVHEDISFRFTDNCELWLLDREKRPVVLSPFYVGLDAQQDG